MSRLVNYGAGDISDRLTILALKIFHGQVAGKETKHWEQERMVLLTQIRARTLNGIWFEQVLELGAVNAALWTATDHLRGRAEALGHEKDEGVVAEHRYQAGTLGIQILYWNDRRAELVNTINKLAGDQLGSEKGKD